MSGTDADRLARIDTALSGIDEDWGSPLADLVFVRRLLREALGDLNGGPARLTPQGLDAATSRPSAQDSASPGLTGTSQPAGDDPRRQEATSPATEIAQLQQELFHAERERDKARGEARRLADNIALARPSAPGPSEADVERVARAICEATIHADDVAALCGLVSSAGAGRCNLCQEQARAALSALGQAPST